VDQQDRRKPSRFHKNIKKEAQAVGREMARRCGVEHFIHNENAGSVNATLIRAAEIPGGRLQTLGVIMPWPIPSATGLL
jgi:hypothetical protein